MNNQVQTTDEPLGVSIRESLITAQEHVNDGRMPRAVLDIRGAVHTYQLDERVALTSAYLAGVDGRNDPVVIDWLNRFKRRLPNDKIIDMMNVFCGVYPG